MYEDSKHFGFDDRAVKILSEGIVLRKPHVDEVSDLAYKYTVAEQGRFNLMTFHDFVKGLSDLLGIQTRTLATIFAYIHCGRLVLANDVMETIWLVLGREYRVGDHITDSGFLQLSRQCGWLDDTSGFDMGNALMSFMHVCRHKRKVSRAGHPVSLKKVPSKDLLSNDPTAGHIKLDNLEGGGRGKISRIDQVEFLLEYCATRRMKSGIEMFVDLHAAAQGRTHELVSQGSPVLLRKTSTAKATPTKSEERRSMKKSAKEKGLRKTAPGSINLQTSVA
jgi:hypothetical protein